MVNDAITPPPAALPHSLRPAENPEVALALSYAPADARGGLRTLIELDDTLAAVLRGGGEPMLMQMRLVWWRDALAALDAAPPPAVPMLVSVAQTLLGGGVTGGQLAEMATGWEILLTESEMDDAALLRFAALRGGVLFDAAAARLGMARDERVAKAGQGWALVDLARHVTDAALAARAMAQARPLLAQARARRWPGRGRALGALSVLAAMDARVPVDRAIPHGAPGRVLRLAWHRMTGR